MNTNINLEDLLKEKEELLAKHPHLLQLDTEIQKVLSEKSHSNQYEKMIRIFEMLKSECESLNAKEYVDRIRMLLESH